MTLAQLAYFVRIAELQSLSKAAAVVRVAQPALSRQVRNLEQELGTPLLIRHAWGVALTPAGELLLARARRLLADADGIRDAVQALAAEPTGRIALGVPSSIAPQLLPPLAERLSRRYPRLRPHFVDGFSAALHARALAGDLDLAILYEDRAMGPLAVAPLIAETLMLIGPVGVEVDPARALAEQPLVLPARPNRLRLIVDAILPPLPAESTVILEVDSVPAILGIVARDRRFTVLPYSAVADEVERGMVRAWDLKAAKARRTLMLGRPLGRQVTAAVGAVEQEIRAVVAELAPRLRWTPLSPV
jgi:LysR family nitrogen assimilation transcriptional regulator